MDHSPDAVLTHINTYRGAGTAYSHCTSSLSGCWVEHTTRHPYFEDTVLTLTVSDDKAAACIPRHRPGHAGKLSCPCAMQAPWIAPLLGITVHAQLPCLHKIPTLQPPLRFPWWAAMAAAANQSKLPWECMGHTDPHGPTIRDTVFHI